KGVASLQRLMTFYLHPQEEHLFRDGAEVPTNTEKAVTLEGISFRYPGNPRYILENFDLVLDQGESLVIVGASGTGKSTLLAIMAGLERRFEDGQVRFMGRAYDEYSHSELRNAIAVVPQKPFLFAETIAANVRMDMDLSDEEVWHALWVAGLD